MPSGPGAFPGSICLSASSISWRENTESDFWDSALERTWTLSLPNENIMSSDPFWKKLSKWEKNTSLTWLGLEDHDPLWETPKIWFLFRLLTTQLWKKRVFLSPKRPLFNLDLCFRLWDLASYNPFNSWLNLSFTRCDHFFSSATDCLNSNCLILYSKLPLY